MDTSNEHCKSMSLSHRNVFCKIVKCRFSSYLFCIKNSVPLDHLNSLKLKDKDKRYAQRD
jgi:hypothetical protein